MAFASWLNASCRNRQESAPANKASESVSVFLAFVRGISAQNETLTIDKLLLELARQSGRQVSSQLMSPSRSLQQGAISHAMPRVLATIERPRGMATATKDWYAKLFFGYAESVDQLEVIAWNEERGEFEFLVIEDLSKKTPVDVRKVVAEPIENCSGCHQNKAPIFGMDPWSETNSNDEVSRAIRQALSSRHMSTTSYFGVPTVTSFGDSQTFDTATDDASELMGLQRLWRESCSTEHLVECRTLLITLSLAGKLFPDNLGPAQKDDYNRLRKLWLEDFPSQGIHIVSSSLGDELMDVGFLEPLDPAVPRSTFKFDGKLPENGDFGLKHDHLSEEFSYKNGYDSTLVFSWMRGLVFSEDWNTMKDQLPDYQTLRTRILAPVCQDQLREVIDRRTIWRCISAQ